MSTIDAKARRTFMAIVKKTYKDQVIDYIYQLMLTDKLNPGDQVKESILSVQMGISRAPVREALKELMMNGLIDYRPQVGNFIPILTAKQIVDSYTTRGILEGYAVMAAWEKFSAEDIGVLDAYVDEMGVAARARKHKRVVDIGGDFHDYLTGKSDNVQLLEYTNRLSLKLHILFYKHWGRLYTPHEIEQRHRAIVDSIRSQDGDRIEKVIRNHYVETGTKIAALQCARSDSAA
jgi:DNA-binding GntR family transcriptional regulator